MRTRSFEGGNQSPSRDEATNWFEEFKARMSKRPSGHSRSHHHKYHTSDEMIEDQYIDLSESIGRGASTHDTKPSPITHNSFKGNTEEAVHDQPDDSSTLTRENCSRNLIHEDKNIDHAKESRFLSSNTKLRRRKLRHPRISSMEADSPDFDTASINTIFNRRDSRYTRQSTLEVNNEKSHNRLILSVRNIFEASFAFDSNLPWKLLSLFCVGVVCILFVLSSQEASTITFVNGLISGILLTLACISIIVLCLLLKMFPLRHASPTAACSTVIDDSVPVDINFSKFNSCKLERPGDTNNEDDRSKFSPMNRSASLDSSTTKEDSLVEPNQQYNSISEDETGEFKGWMIEFMGDYELRKTGDIKLQLIFIRLDGTILRLCKPKNNNDSNGSSFPIFTQQRIYDLASTGRANICLLLPKSIRNREKWIWSKKYPLRLEFYSQESVNSSPKLLKFTLFVRSCREKEEWFQRLRIVVDRCRPPQDLLPPISSSPTTGSLHSSQDQEEVFSDCNTTTSRCNTPLAQSKSEIMSPGTSKKSIGSLLNPFAQDPSTDASSLTDHLSDSSYSGLVRTKSCELISMRNLANTSNELPNKKQDKTNDDQLDVPDPSLNRKPRHSADDASIRSSAEALNTDQSSDVGGGNSSMGNRKNKPNFDYKEFIDRVIESGLDSSPNSKWFNSLVGRMFFDVFSHAYWSVWFKRKIQRKLYRIRLPYFMETLTLTKIDLGTNPPQFRKVVSHNFDSFGLNIDFDMAYSGGLEMTFETKLNLLKIRDNSNASTASEKQQQQQQQQQATSTDMNESSSVLSPSTSGSIASNSVRASDESSDTEDSDSILSSDSSSDEGDVDEISDWEDYGAERTRQTIVRFVDKIASSRYFQHATENKYIKKKLQDISNCPLVLVVQIQSLNGILSLNVPPPPTDRLWYGFKPNPDLVLRALPKMGDREVSLTPVTEWIERKLVEEFRKILVIPNMEDIVLPVLKTDSDRYVTVVP